MFNHKLIIFDCDGVLVDSEIIACGSVSECLKDAGIELTTEEIIKSYAGISTATMVKDLGDRFGPRLPPNFTETLRARTSESLDRDIKPIEGVKWVLSTISDEKCVASSSSPQRIFRSLELTGLKEYFDHTFSAAQVKRGKPAPDLFLYAAQSMRVPPKHCIVIEDSVAGVQAGHAAGMRVLGFTGGSHCQPEQAELLKKAGALRIFNRMIELPTLLDNLD